MNILPVKNGRKVAILAVCSILLALTSSCSNKTSPLTYFKDINELHSEVQQQAVPLPKLAPDDELFITVTSLEPAAAAPFNLAQTNPGLREELDESAATPKQQTFVVNSRGELKFPQLGRIHVAGMTTEQLCDMLTERISQSVEDPLVIVELVNFRVNVLGEVKKPGAVKVMRQRYSVLDALADAGDMTEFGERSNVLLIRENGGKQERIRLDLNSSEVLTSPYFYLQPNDYIYVEPNKIRQDNSRYNMNNSYKLTVVSTIVSAASVIASLIIALTVK